MIKALIFKAWQAGHHRRHRVLGGLMIKASLYAKMRAAQLGEAIEEDQRRKADPSTHAAACGPSQEDIEYLGRPIEAVRHVTKYGISKDKSLTQSSMGEFPV